MTDPRRANQLDLQHDRAGQRNAARPWAGRRPTRLRKMSRFRPARPRRRGLPHQREVEPGREAPRARKYVVCNADEGEPGTFKDRVILSDFADLVFEGMTIGGYAIGASRGLSTCGANTPTCAPTLELCCKRRARKPAGREHRRQRRLRFRHRDPHGLRRLRCGEETALIESLEGHRGEPRNRPPFPVDTGFLGKPTIVNNVETLAWVACILAKGADWFKRIGTDKSPGRKLFSISGDCTRPGVYEFPMGITVARTAARKWAAKAPRRCRSAAPPGSACRPRSSPAPSPMRTSPPAARSSSSARTRHAARGPELPGILRGRVLRPVHALPRRHPRAAGRRRYAGARPLLDEIPAGALRPGRNHAGGLEVRPGPIGPNAFLSDRRALPGRDHWGAAGAD